MVQGVVLLEVVPVELVELVESVDELFCCIPEGIRAKKELDLPALAPQAPWYGYSLGDWDERYDVYARRAVAGQWAESGAETFQHRRGGLTPETPVRDATDTAKKP